MHRRSSPALRGRWPKGPEGASWAYGVLAPSAAQRQLPRNAGEHLVYAPGFRSLGVTVTVISRALRMTRKSVGRPMLW